MRSAVSCEPLVVSFVLSLILSLALRLLPQRTGTAPDFAPGVEVSIRSGTSGKYVEVGDTVLGQSVNVDLAVVCCCSCCYLMWI